MFSSQAPSMGKGSVVDSAAKQVTATAVAWDHRSWEQLKLSEENYRTIFENSAVAITVSNKDEQIVTWNRFAEALLGVNGDALYLRPVSSLYPEEEWAKIRAQHVRRKGIQHHFETRIIRKEKQTVDIDLSLSVLKGSDGNVIGSIGIMADISERKRMEENQRKLQQELSVSSRLASVGKLASGVAHEINNPLTSVIAFSKIMMAKDIPEDAKEDLKIIDENAQRVAKIVSNLLFFARQRKPGRGRVDLNSLISQVIELRAYNMKSHNIEVTAEFAPDLPLTMADGGQLQQVFLNIILNAEQAMSAVHNNKGNLLIKTERIDNIIRMSFRDDGPGIASGNLDKIFDPFFTTKPVGEGDGLGLSLSYGIIKEHGGKIYANSMWGQGATFVVELPIVSEPERAELAGTPLGGLDRQACP